MNGIIVPPATIGIVGGGQLGMMSAREAQRMGYRTAAWDPDRDCPAFRLTDVQIAAPFGDPRAAEELARVSDVITYEFEHVDPDLVEWLAGQKPLFPGPELLRISRYRLREKEELNRRGFPIVEYAPASAPPELELALKRIGFPAVVKTASAGYDGKGQYVVRDRKNVEEMMRGFGEGFPELVVERFLSLRCEMSVIVVRGKDGSISTFPVAENEHRENILHITRVPARISRPVEQQALELAREIAESFRLIGVLCVEMFVTKDDRILVNELAPRPHNSGHFSLDACSVSQFEALIRSVCGVPIQSPRLLTPCAMINLLGKHISRLDVSRVQAIEGTKVHLYGKKRIEARRKMGHITVLGESQASIEATIRLIEEMIGEDAPSEVKQREKPVSVS